MLTKLSTTVVLATSLVACVRNDGLDVDSAESALDSQETVEAEGNLVRASLDGADATALVAATSDQVAVQVAANINARFPGGCVAATANGSTVNVAYVDCSGPYGLVHVTGDLTLALAVALDGTISVHATADALQINQAVIDVDADATLSGSGATHQLAVHTQGSGSGPRGYTIDHAGDYTLAWDTQSSCVQLDGAWSTELDGPRGAGTRGNTVNLERCNGGCASGTIVHTGAGGATLTITLDGAGTATWTGSGGRSGSVALACH